MKLIQEIILDHAKVQLFESNLVRIEIFSDHIIALDESRQINDALGILSKGKQALVLMVAEEFAQFERSATDFSASDEGLRYTIADALVVKSLSHKILANFYLKFNKPAKPTKIFTNEVDAVKWLFSLTN
ncbi:MAG: hypothetical protein H0U95_01370 [Bacteroidetes bacterium]|nr:hypothetical protein [Bacteroidota bacterium]